MLRRLPALPVSREIHRHPHGSRELADHAEQGTVRLPAVIFPPRHFGGIPAQVHAADAVMLAPLSTAQTGEEAFRLIGAGIVSAVSLRVVDNLHGVLGAESFPTLGFIGVNDGALFDAGLDEADRCVFRLEHGGKGASAPLAGGNHHLALAGLVHGKATVLTVFLAVLRADVTADVAAVNLDRFTGPTDRDALHFGRQCFAELVSQYEGRLVRDIQIAAKLQGADALDGVHENHDRGHVVPDRQLVVGEQRARRGAEVAAARLAAVARRGAPGDIVANRAFAVRANRGAVRVGPAEIAEHGPGIRLRQPQNSLQANRSSGGGEEEVLGHDRVAIVCVTNALFTMARCIIVNDNCNVYDGIGNEFCIED